VGKFGADAAALTEPRIRAWLPAIKKHAAEAGVPASVVAGIISRETAGLPQYCVPPTQGGQLGDNGHGHGPMQIDDRAFPAWCYDWRIGAYSTEDGIAQGCAVLKQKAQSIAKLLPSLHEQDALHATIAAYNCGEGNVRHAVMDDKDIDTYTAWQNYGADVLQRAAYFAQQGYDE